MLRLKLMRPLSLLLLKRKRPNFAASEAKKQKVAERAAGRKDAKEAEKRRTLSN